MFSEPDKASFFSDFKNLVVDYIKTRLELSKLSAFEKIAKIVTYLLIAFMSAMVFFLALFFLSLMFAEYLKIQLNSQILAYGIIGGIYFLIFLIFLRSANGWIGRRITDNIIKILFEQSNKKTNGD